MLNTLTVLEPQAITGNADLLEFVNQWRAALDLRTRAGELSPTTAQTYKIGFGKFLDWLEEGGIRSGVNADLIRNWKADLLAQGYKPGTVNTWLAGPRSFFAWAVSERLTAYNPTDGVKGASRKGTTKSHKREGLTNNEVRRLLAMPDPTKPQGKRDIAILSIMVYTGVRTVEIHRANLADLRTQSGQLVLYVQGKGHDSNDEFVIIPQNAINAVYNWLAARGNKPGPLFTSLSNRTQGERLSLRAIRGIVKGYYRAAGIQSDNKTTHSLRHTAITNAIQNGAPPQKVMGMSRHKDINTLMIYYHELDRVSDPAENYINYGE